MVQKEIEIFSEKPSLLETASMLDRDSKNYPTRYAKRFLALAREYAELSPILQEEFATAASGMLDTLRSRKYTQTDEKREGIGYGIIPKDSKPKETPDNAVEKSRYNICLGLSQIPSPSAQLVLAREINIEIDANCRRRFTTLLRGYGEILTEGMKPSPIYPETVAYFLANGNPDEDDFALKLIRNNPIRISEGGAFQILEDYFRQGFAAAADNASNIALTSDLACLAEHYEGKVNGNLLKNAEDIIAGILEERIKFLTQPDNFASYADRNAKLNLFDAKKYIKNQEEREEKLHSGMVLKEAKIPTLVKELIDYEFMPEVYLAGEFELLSLIKRLRSAEGNTDPVMPEEDLRLLNDLIAARSRELLIPLVTKDLEAQKKLKDEEAKKEEDRKKEKERKKAAESQERQDRMFQKVETQKASARLAYDRFALS